MSDALLKDNLFFILLELRNQPELSKEFPSNMIGYDEYMKQLDEYVEHADEYEVAYESIVCLLEQIDFKLSGSSAVKLLEIGLTLKYKTHLEKDRMFDIR